MRVPESQNWIIGHELINLTDRVYYTIISTLYMLEYFKGVIY